MTKEAYEKTDTLSRIKLALDEIRPFLKEDGGDINLIEVSEEGQVMVEFTGACKSCDMNTSTFHAGVESTILRYAPEVSSVVSVNLTS